MIKSFLKTHPETRYRLNTTLQSLRQYPRDLLFRFRTMIHGGMPPMPPPFLRYRVAGHYDIAQFHEGGLGSRTDFEKALASIRTSFADFHTILDFGAGCSRIMRWMGDVSRNAELHGTDIDPRAIRWSKGHIRHARFKLNQGLPPLDYADGTFDLVYSHSVFTHLDEEYQDAWLAELDRVTKPGAVLLLTVHGSHAWQGFRDSAPEHPAMIAHVAAYEQQGFHFVRDDEWTGVFPDFYHSMFHQKGYILQHWGRILPILNYMEQGMLNFQDIVVVKKR